MFKQRKPQKLIFKIKAEITVEESIYQILDNIDHLITDGYFGSQVALDNDGIGAYEYWGAKGYDCGQSYLICEGNYNDDTYILKVNISEFPELKDDEKFIVDQILLDTEQVIESDKYNTQIEIHLNPTVTYEGNYMIFNLEWREVPLT